MKALLVELDDELAAQVERIAPGRSRRRSAFIRMALRRAIGELEERATHAAYLKQPDNSEGLYFDASVWEPLPTRAKKRRRRAR